MARPGDTIEKPATGERMVFIQTAADTGGALLQLEFVSAPGGFRPPRHVHARVDERLEVVSGRLAYRVGAKQGMLGPGESVDLPAGAPHEFWNDSGERTRFIVDVRPALNMETMFETIFALYRDGKTNREGIPSLLQSVALGRAYDAYLAGPPVVLQKAALAVAAPIAGLLGYKPRYPEYSGPE